MEVLGNILLVILLSGFIFVSYYIGTRKGTQITYKIEVPEIKVNLPEKVVEVKPNESAEKLRKEYETYLQKEEKEQERLPDELRTMKDVNETVNTVYEAFLNGTPIEGNSNDA